MNEKGPIGVFDSGYGGLTVLKEIAGILPEYDYIYLGDNARAPYGPRSFETVYEYTLECVKWFFKQQCSLIILACNTASAKALRTIQQNDLPKIAPTKRVLGVIRPTTERIGEFTKTGSVGVLGTKGTVQSESYLMEIEKFFPEVHVFQQACPMWVPLIENGEYNTEGANYFIRKYLDSLFTKGTDIDTLLLACTHYPLIKEQIRGFLPRNVSIVQQGEIVAESLKNYLNRHPEIETCCSRGEQIKFYTTDSAEDFNVNGTIFFGKPVVAQHVSMQ